MLNIAIVEDEKEMSNCLRDYLIKFFNEENISIDISIFDNGNIFLYRFENKKEKKKCFIYSLLLSKQNVF